MSTAEADGAAAPSRSLRKLCVFCGASPGKKPEYLAAARAMGQELVRRNIGLVYGGGTVGLMGEVARTVLDGFGGTGVTGVIPEALAPREVTGELIGDMHIVNTMHERKALMAAQSDGFIGMPGGFGTLEELLEVITWQQLGFHDKPVGLLNIDGFYDALLGFFDHCTAEGFIHAKHSKSVLVSSDPGELIDLMAKFQAPPSYITMSSSSRQQALSMDVAQPSPPATST